MANLPFPPPFPATKTVAPLKKFATKAVTHLGSGDLTIGEAYMARNILKISALAFLASASVLSAAQAGGFARGTADTDILFEEGNFNIRSGATYVNPTRKFTVNANPALVGTSYTDAYAIFSGAVKLNVNDDLRCAATFSQPYGGAVSYVSPSLPSGKRSENFTINEMGVTCG